MDGLDKLLASIQDDADSRIAILQQETADYAARLNDEAEAKRRDVLDQSKAAADADAAQMIARAESLVRADRRKAELGRRQADVQRVIDAALDFLRKKTKDERVTLYSGIIRNHGIEPGAIVLGGGDRDIADMLLAKLPDGFSLAEISDRFDGGFVVRRGNVEENLTYDLAVRNHRPELAQQATAMIDREKA